MVFPPWHIWQGVSLLSKYSQACAADVDVSLFILSSSSCVGMLLGIWLALVQIWLGCGCKCVWPPIPAVVGIGIFVGSGGGLFGM